MAIEFTLNGAPVSVRADHPHLLAALREELDITSPKDGCSPSGQCGYEGAVCSGRPCGRDPCELRADDDHLLRLRCADPRRRLLSAATSQRLCGSSAGAPLAV